MIYFIKPIGMDGPIKIGTSVSPDGRLRTLEHWSPFPLEIAAQMQGGTKEERRLHDAFARFHINHEWFQASPEILAVVASVNRGDFDLDSLPVPERAPGFRRSHYDCPEYRYGLSVQSRLSALQRKGLARAEMYSDPILHHEAAELLLNKDAVEAAILRLRALVPA